MIILFAVNSLISTCRGTLVSIFVKGLFINIMLFPMPNEYYPHLVENLKQSGSFHAIAIFRL